MSLPGCYGVTAYPYRCGNSGSFRNSLNITFFSELHDSLLNDTIDDSFFEFTGDFFKGISSYFVNNIKKTEYGNDVVMTITDTASEYLDDYIKLANRIRVKLADVLAQQRGGYYGFGDKKKEYFVFDQAPNIDKTITNNIEQGRQCGDSDNRLKKKPSIQTICRGVILKRTTALRDANPNPSQFRKMGSVVKILEEIQSERNR